MTHRFATNQSPAARTEAMGPAQRPACRGMARAPTIHRTRTTLCHGNTVDAGMGKCMRMDMDMDVDVDMSRHAHSGTRTHSCKATIGRQQEGSTQSSGTPQRVGVLLLLPSLQPLLELQLSSTCNACLNRPQPLPPPPSPKTSPSPPVPYTSSICKRVGMGTGTGTGTDFHTARYSTVLMSATPQHTKQGLAMSPSQRQPCHAPLCQRHHTCHNQTTRTTPRDRAHHGRTCRMRCDRGTHGHWAPTGSRV